MAATFLGFYNGFADQLGDELHDLETDALKMVYHTAVPSASWAQGADITNELTGNGYTPGGETLASVVFGVDDTDKAKLTSAGVTITAGVGGLTFSHWSIINTTSDRLICYGTCDGGSDIVLTEGVPYTLNPHANGWFRIEPAA